MYKTPLREEPLDGPAGGGRGNHASADFEEGRLLPSPATGSDGSVVETGPKI